MPAKFELTKDATGRFRFSLKAANGEIIATSEAYETKPSALNGIESARSNAQRRGRRPHLNGASRWTRAKTGMCSSVPIG
jgi:uncharacterized protein YegP (UPF0339 family)